MLWLTLLASSTPATEACPPPSPTTPDGRVTISMPHPERVFRAVQCSFCPDEWQQDGPWLRLFRNARRWVGWVG